MPETSELPVTVPKPPKTRIKLPIYIVTAIVIVLVVAVLIINLLHRKSHSSGDADFLNKTEDNTEVSSTEYGVTVLTTTDGTVKSSTGFIEPISTDESSNSSSSESDEETTVRTATTENTTVWNTTVESSTSAEILSTQAPSTEIPLIPSPSSSSETSTETSSTSSSSSAPEASSTISPTTECDQTCRVNVVESIPRGVHFYHPVETKNAYESWAGLLSSAQSEIDIFAYKMNLRGTELMYDYDNSTIEGRNLYEIIKNKASSGVVVKLIDCKPPTRPENDLDANELEKLGLIQRQGLEMNSLNGGGGGVQHSKTFIVDDRHIFVGSLNFEWKSFSQKLEIGLEFVDCPCIASDASHLFDEIFDSLAGTEKLELVEYKQHRIGNSTFTFLSSPSFLLSSSSSWDLEKLLNVIYEANDFVDIAVMQYFPSWIYFKNGEFYSQIDNAIRMSISRGVQIRFLVSGDSKEEQKLMFSYLHSLQVLHSPIDNRTIQVKFILIPQSSQESYKDRKLHAKFMISEKDSFVGSSNYAPEYFYKSSGTAVLVEEEPHNGKINQQLKNVFERYWNSQYTLSLYKFGESRGYLPRTSKPSNPFAEFFGFDRIGYQKETYSSTKLVIGSEASSDEDEILDPVIFI